MSSPPGKKQRVWADDAVVPTGNLLVDDAPPVSPPTSATHATTAVAKPFCQRALIIVDVQNDFISGSLQVGTDAADIVAPINALRGCGWGLVVYTMDSHPANHCSFADNHPGAAVFEQREIPAPDGSAATVAQVMWPRHCVDGSPGWELHPDLAVAETDHVQKKGTDPAVDSYSGFFDNFAGASTGLEKVLENRGITEVYVCGLAYDYCAGSTACDAARLGFKTHLIKDLTRSVASASAEDMASQLAKAAVNTLDADAVPALVPASAS